MQGAPASPGVVTLLGVPHDVNSSHIEGPSGAPGVIRAALYSRDANWSFEDGGRLSENPRFTDAGDLALPREDCEAGFRAIVEGAGGVLGRGGLVLVLGGDHSVSYPLVKAHAAHRDEPFGIVQIDAHPDLYEDFEGNPYSHASGFARILEGGLCSKLVQVGIRASTKHQRQQAERYGVTTIDAGAELRFEGWPSGPVYLSVDLDGLDPAFAPGVSHPEPGGLSTRDVLRVIQAMPGQLIGADIVELNPHRDLQGATAMVAAKLVKEIVARLLRDNPTDR